MPRIHVQTSVLSNGRQEISLQLPSTYDPHYLHFILDAFNVNTENSSEFYVSCNGHVLQDDDVLESKNSYRLNLRLRGGKGGFGSMLRAIGAQIEKTTSREACRDLSGRRMRDVNNEKKLKDWVAKQSDREKDKLEKKRERRERQKQLPGHKFSDRQYDEQTATVKENLEDALQQGLNRQAPATLDSRKRKSEDQEEGHVNETKRKAAEWLGLDIDALSDLGSSDESDDDGDDGMVGVWPSLPFSDNVASSGGSNMSTAVQFSDAESKESSEWENPDHFVEMENGDHTFEIPVHSDELLERLGNSPAPSAGYSKSDAGSIRSERGECSKSDAGSIRSERGECSKSDAGSFVSDLSHLETKSSKSNEPLETREIEMKTSPIDEMLEVTEADLPLVLDDYEKAENLHLVGLDKLKSELMSRGLKCGGTLEQRAERLFSVKGLTPDEYNPSIISKGGKSKSSQR